MFSIKLIDPGVFYKHLFCERFTVRDSFKVTKKEIVAKIWYEMSGGFFRFGGDTI